MINGDGVLVNLSALLACVVLLGEKVSLGENVREAMTMTSSYMLPCCGRNINFWPYMSLIKFEYTLLTTITTTTTTTTVIVVPPVATAFSNSISPEILSKYLGVTTLCTPS